MADKGARLGGAAPFFLAVLRPVIVWEYFMARKLPLIAFALRAVDYPCSYFFEDGVQRIIKKKLNRDDY